MSVWIDTPEGWDRVARRLVREGSAGRPVGLDCELDGVVLREKSPVGRARLVVWSVAVFDGTISPRGHRRAAAVGLPEAAADHPPLRAWLESPAPKVAHNAPTEAHTFGNRGIAIGGLINTLPMSRWVLPGRKDFGLDSLGVDLLGVGKVPWNWKRPNVVTVERRKKERACECGAVPCRRQQKTPGHRRIETVREWTEEVIRGEVAKDVRAIVPGHPEWETWLAYFVRDARLALSLWDALRLRDRRVVNPWARAAKDVTPHQPSPVRGQVSGLWAEEAA